MNALRREILGCATVVATAAVLLPSACGFSGRADRASEADSGPSDAGGSDAGRDSQLPAQDGQSALPSLGAFNSRDDIWIPIKNGGACGLREGRVVPDPFPRRTWQSCGSGCRLSAASPQFDAKQYVNSNVAGGAFLGDDTYLLLPSYSDDAFGRTMRIERLSDGATLAAVLDRGPRKDTSCALAWRGGAAPLLFEIFDGDKTLFGVASRTPGSPIRWHESWLTGFTGNANERFVSDVGYGHATYGELLILKGQSSLAPETLSPGSGLAHGHGSQVIWGYDGSGSIRSFTQSTGPIDLIPLPEPRVPMGSRLSDTRIVWVDAVRSGERFSDARWHWSPRTTSAAGVVVHDGPPVPVTGMLVDMQTTGDWAAADGYLGPGDSSSEIRMFIWNIPTGQTFILPNRPGHQFARVLAITPTELVVGERAVSPVFAPVLDHIVRIELAALPSLAEAWSL